MKLKKILALLTILLLTLTACKSTEEPVDDKKPLKLSDRVGVYKGSTTINNKTYYSVLEVKNTGEISPNASSGQDIFPLSSTPTFSTTSELTSFTVDTASDNASWDIVFTSESTLTLKCPTFNRDYGVLTKE